MDNLSPELREKIEQLLDQNVQLAKDNLALKSTIKQRDEQLQELEEELNSQLVSQKRVNDAASVRAELESQLKLQREMLDERTNELCSVQLELDATKRALADAQKTLAELENAPSVFERSEVVSEPSDSEEFAQLQEERDQLLFAMATAHQMERSLKESLEELRGQNEMSREEIVDLKRNLRGFAEQVTELECQLSDVHNSVGFASRGNSMFGEFADQYSKLSETTTSLIAETKMLRKVNARLTEDVEEARLLASKMEGAEKVGRCVCSELQAQETKRRLEVEHLQRRLHSLEIELARRAEKLKNQEASPVFRSMLDSLKAQLHSTNDIVTSLRVERNQLQDKNIELAVAEKRAANGEKIAIGKLEIMSQLYEGLKKRYREGDNSGDKPENLEPASLPFPPKTPAPPVREKISNIDKTAHHVVFDTPAKPPPFLQQQTPAPIDDPLKRLSIARTLNFSEQRNETMTKQEKRLARGALKTKPLGVKGLAPSFSMVRVNVTGEGVTGAEPVNDTIAIFEKPKLPPAKLNVPSASEGLTKKLFPPRAAEQSLLNRTNHDNVSMAMDSTFDIDLSKTPFDVTALEECDSDQENVDATLP